MPTFTRFTLNDNHWIIPSGQSWRTQDQGRSDVPYENQYGFSHEEWLFNTRYHLGGYQYGYIRGLRNARPPGNMVDRVYLYGVKREDPAGRVYYVGYINAVELVGPGWRTLYPAVADAYDGYEPAVFQEIREARGDTAGLDEHEFRPVVRFRMDSVALVAAPVIIDNFPLATYPGYAAYTLTPEVLELFDRAHIV